MSALASVFIATSADGFIARPDGSLDWLYAHGPSGDTGYDAFIANIDAIVMGRATFDVVRGFDGPWPYGDLRVVVWTRTPEHVDTSDLPHVEASALPPAELMQYVSERGANRVYVDGGATVRAFMSTGLLDQLIVTQVPVLLGTGIPLWGEVGGDIGLTHVRTEVIGGSVQTTWKVSGRPMLASAVALSDAEG